MYKFADVSSCVTDHYVRHGPLYLTGNLHIFARRTVSDKPCLIDRFVKHTSHLELIKHTSHLELEPAVNINICLFSIAFHSLLCWDSSFSTMHYLNYILVAACFVVLVLAILFLLRECCYDGSSDNSEMFMLRGEETYAPNYTETTAEREHLRGHRIAHEFNRHQNVVLLSSAHSMAQQPPPYYAYDTTSRATYYMYPAPQSTAGSSNVPTSAQLVQRSYVETSPSTGTTTRPPPYAPHHH